MIFLNLKQFLDRLEAGSIMSGTITSSHQLPAVPQRCVPFPDWVSDKVRDALGDRGIKELYTHQRQAVDHARAGQSVVVVTPTASGKTLCYNLPVIQSIIQSPLSRALYLFPTKALSQDQLAELQSLLDVIGDDIKVHTYDGDTPGSARTAIRTAAHIVITNPDMLHSGILPHHTKWRRLFENLQFVVIDELHQYRGIFGSHTANLLRRLKRICEFYGSKPTFILSSATIANPAELASQLISEPVVCCDDNGAPCGQRLIVTYNPPVVNSRLGIRRSSLLEASALASQLIANDISTIVFARSRLAVEIILTYLRRSLGPKAHLVSGYRGGYLPRERRRIERDLRSNRIKGVVSTNALELGIDIGSLEVSISAGYPGTIASFWQQAGRAGRRSAQSLSVLIASSAALDQFIVNNPHYLLGSSPESGLINPENLQVLSDHVKCAAFELPFLTGESLGSPATPYIIDYLTEHSILRHTGGRYYWMSETFPAEDISLRSAEVDNVVIIHREPGKETVIGEVDRFSAPMLVHDEAIYIHDGEQYQVERLDLELNKAFVRKESVDYYTDANLAVNLAVLDQEQDHDYGWLEAARGEVAVTALATIFKKIKLHTHENVGWGKIHLPEEQLHTSACWWRLPQAIVDQLAAADLPAALWGLATAIRNIAPLLVMADPRDIRTTSQTRSPFTGAPTIFAYDAYPGGIGLATKLFAATPELWDLAADLVRSCPCSAGCPSCVVGPGDSADKRAVLTVLNMLGVR